MEIAKLQLDFFGVVQYGSLRSAVTGGTSHVVISRSTACSDAEHAIRRETPSKTEDRVDTVPLGAAPIESASTQPVGKR